MSTFVKGGSTGTPFGRNEFLRSTKILQTESYTVAAASVLPRTIDGNANQKILQPGTVMAKITSGGDAGKIGPYSTDTAGVTDGRSTIANAVGLELTFLPWTLVERDVEVSVVYDCYAVQAWCLEYTLAGAAVPQPLSNTTADALRNLRGMDLHFK
jgi:hypothetical protein